MKNFYRQFYLNLKNLNLSNYLKINFLTKNHNLPKITTTYQNIIKSKFHNYLIFHNKIINLPPQNLFKLLKTPKIIHNTNYNNLKRLIKR